MSRYASVDGRAGGRKVASEMNSLQMMQSGGVGTLFGDDDMVILLLL